MNKLLLAVAMTAFTAPALAGTQCVTTVTTITDADGVPLPSANQLIDRVCGLDADTALEALYLRKGVLGKLYQELAGEVGNGDDVVTQVNSVYGD